jgi:hypothetical protein
VPYGALTQLWAGTTEEGKTLGGKVSVLQTASCVVRGMS